MGVGMAGKTCTQVPLYDCMSYEGHELTTLEGWSVLTSGPWSLSVVLELLSCSVSALCGAGI